ncbi:hypothetical protein JAAARDRAFT_28764 [Jaapia argillacea MUCL 33604]|uniref:Acyl-CoA desaturase n=1 Tax=Jaapia argillacea MUCL 33604 TaxID=933084 RepID=A0A067QFY1_9AGAM|nr:hypothetical protein JAAARDRAFT_28764 [Jaapia argillacea MUCL 33604]
MPPSPLADQEAIARYTSPVSSQLFEAPSGLSPELHSKLCSTLWQTLWQTCKRIRWFNLIVVATTPLVVLYGTYTTPLTRNTFAFCVFYYVFNMLGITAGYHRLWSHRSYTASIPLELFLACGGSGAVQGSIQWWSRGHRSHHRYTDTDLDPYGAQHGLLYTHIGWMVVKPTIKPGRVDIEDLKKNPVVKWQHEWYFILAAIWGLVVPTVVPGYFWGDWWGGWYFAGFARMVAVHHSTFCVNSIAHYLGSTPYSDAHSPRDHLITAILTLGEGYHNFHHQFPSDYRNAVRWYQYDPTKWFIRACNAFGFAHNLQRFRESEVRKCRLYMEVKRVKQAQDEIERRWGWGKTVDDLEIWTWERYQSSAQKRPLVLVSGFIHDVTEFLAQHPGGQKILQAYVGKDATSAFCGGVYQHSDAARNLLATQRIAILDGGMEVVQQSALPPCRKLQIIEFR